MSYEQVCQEFTEWLDSVCTKVDTTKPIVDPERDYAQEKFEKQEKAKHNYLLKHHFWYRQAYTQHKREEQLRLEQGDSYVETEAKRLGEDGFWEQF